MGNVFQRSGGGSGNIPSTTPVAVGRSDHEELVQFAREFVVDLVESVPKKSEKTAVTAYLQDDVSLKSVTPSEGSFQSGTSVAEHTSLPDLLQLEFVYKKQTDTDTDTTEYESAAETEPLDATPAVSSIVEDLVSSSQGVSDIKREEAENCFAGSPVECVGTSGTEASEVDETFDYKTVTSDKSLTQCSDSSLSESYEDAGDSTAKTSVADIKVKSLDITNLCLCISHLCLDSPNTNNVLFDYKDKVYSENLSDSSSVPVNNAVVTNQPEDLSENLAGKSTFDLEVSEECRLGVLENSEISYNSFDVESPERNAVSLEAATKFNSEGLLLKDNPENDSNTTEVTTGNIEVEFSKSVEPNYTASRQCVVRHSDIQKEHSFLFDANLKPSVGTIALVDGPVLHTDITDAVDTSSLLESESTSGLDSTGNSAFLEISSVEKEAISEILETAIRNAKSKSEAVITLKSVEDLESASLVAPIPANVENIGTSDWQLPVEEKQSIEFVKDAPAVLSELFEICSRQQKDLELSDEKFVDGTEFFTSSKLGGKTEVDVSCRSIQGEFEEAVLDQPTQGEFTEFDETIADEAEKILQEIMNSSSEIHETGLVVSDSRCANNTEKSNSQYSTENMADLRGVSSGTTAVKDENGVKPVVSETCSRRSSPSSGRPSPRTGSQVPSPCESPRTKSKLASANAVKDGAFPCGLAAAVRSRDSDTEGCTKNSFIPEMNHSEAGPEIADDAHLQDADVFKDPAAFEYLSSVGSSHECNLRKESLYVKFDPLVGGTSRATDKVVLLPPSVEESSSMSTDSSFGKEHNSGFTTPVKNPALTVIDKLISLSPSPVQSRLKSADLQPVVSPVTERAPASVTQEPAASSCSETQIGDSAILLEELYLLRELCAAQDEKYKERLAHLEQDCATLRGHVEHLQSLVKESEDCKTKLNKKVAEKAQAQKQMSMIMEEYEKTISRLVAEKEQDRQAHEQEKLTLLKDRDAAMGHLANIEIAFSDVHKKYERSKAVIEGFKKNEEVLRASLADYEATICKQEQKYDLLKSHAVAQLESANQELDSLRRSQQAESAKLNAMLKKAEVKTSSLEEMLEQKVKENQELTSICDELISKVGGNE